MSVNVYEAGTAISFSEGEYSDYGYAGHVVTMKRCDLPALAQEFKDSYKAKDEWDKPDPGAFVAWLCSQGHCFPADVEECHIGSYGRLEVAS